MGSPLARVNPVFHDGHPFWAGEHQPYTSAPYHYLVAGCTGSGKSVTLQLLMQSVLPKVADNGVSHRALVYDSKQDLLPTLAAIIDPDLIHILNPFHQQGSAWDIAQDVDSPSVAFQVAEVFVPADKNASQPFFTDAARHILAGVFTALRETHGEGWTLRDAVLAVRSGEQLSEILTACPYTKHLSIYFQDGREQASILSTLATKMAKFEPLAAASQKCDSKVSLKKWAKERSVLVLSNDETTRSICDAFNQAIFHRLSQIILGSPDHPHRRTWFFLDEVREAGKLEGLTGLLNRGRSKGACVALGFQDIEGLRDAYGEHLANEIVGQCGAKAIFRLQSPETAKWAEGLGGSVLREEQSFNAGTSFGSNQSQASSGGSHGSNSGESYGNSRSLQERKQFFDSEFLSNPFPVGDTLQGFYFVRKGFFKKSFAPFGLLTPKRVDVPASMRRQNPRDEMLEPWTSEELKGLRLTRKLEQVAAEQVAAKPVADQQTVDKRPQANLPDDLGFLPPSRPDLGIKRLH